MKSNIRSYSKALSAAVLLACGIGLCASVEAAVTLVEDGKSQCTIVMGTERSKSKAYSIERSKTTQSFPSMALPESAADLADHLDEMAQIWNPRFQVRVVNSTDQARTKHRILLGSAAVKEYGLEKEAEALSYPTYIYRVVGNDLLIFGSSPKGTANGIYGFLQEELGVRWFGPQEIFRVVPKRKTIIVKDVNKRVAPSFPGRVFGVSTRRTHPAYVWGRRRMRMGEAVDDNEPFVNASHNLWRLYPTRVYAKKHPEYYPVRNGKRMVPDHHNWTPCLTNPEVIAIAVKGAKDFFRGDKQRHSFSLGINDTGVFCQCKECQKHNTGFLFRGATDWESDVYYWYINKVARAVAEEFPDRYIGTIAYNNVTAPPVGPVEKNVHVVIVNDISEYYDPAYRKLDEELVSAWEKKGITLGLYYYEGLAKLVPAYFPRLVAQEMKDKHKRGFTSIRCEINPGWPWTGPMAYVTAQLWWNVNLNVDDLLQEYFTMLYGPAAKPMSKLYDLFEQIHMRPRSGGFLYEHYKFAQFRPYTAADLAKMRAYLAEAHSLAIEQKGPYKPPKDDIAQRVAYVSNGLKVFLTMLDAYTTAMELEKPVEFDNISAFRRLEDIDRLNAILANHDALYRETIRGDRFQSQRYTWDRCIPVRNGWKTFVSSAISKSMVDLYRWNAKNQADDRVKARFERELATFNADPLRRAMFRLSSGKANLGPNLVANPGFEKATGTGKHPTGPEWVAAQSDGWSLWPEKDKAGFDVVTNERRAGKSSARISGIRGGTYITTIPNVKAGESYHVTAWVKCLPPKQGEVKSSVKLSVQWFNNKNGWWKYGSNTFSDELREVNKWVKLETIVMVPKGPAAAVLLLSANQLDAGQDVFFDDVTFQKVGASAVKLGPNMLKNGGFEQVYGEAPHMKIPPGREKGFPYGWHGRAKVKDKGIMDTVATAPHSGRLAARMRGVGKNAYFLRPTKPLGKPGGFYLCEAWAKNMSQSANTRVHLEIRWYNKKGWMYTNIFKSPLKEAGKWSRIEIVAKPPEGAIQMAFFLMADNLEPDDEVLFDDASVRRIEE